MGYDSTSMKDRFTEIYHQNTWGSEVSRSGPGSHPDRAGTIGPILERIIREYRIKSFLDAPCGDWMWMKELQLPLETYLGIDIVDDVIAANKQRFADSRHSFEVADISCADLPQFDLIFCRDCFVHFSFADIFRTLENFQRSGCRYLLTTTFRRAPGNIDIVTGGWRVINLLKAPFCFPQPLEFFVDWTSDERYSDKSFGLWDLHEMKGI